MEFSQRLMAAIAASTPSNPTALYRLYNLLAKKYFPENMPRAGHDVHIIANPLQVQQEIGSQWFPGVDANGMVTSPANSPILLFVNPFFTRYPRLMYMTMAHEMVHAYCHHQYRVTGDVRWLDEHGPRFQKIAEYAASKGLTGIKASQDLVKLPHSYFIIKGHSRHGGFFFLRLEDRNEMSAEIVEEFKRICDSEQPMYIGEMNSSIVSIFPFIEDNKIVGEFTSYGDDPQLKLHGEKAYKWPVQNQEGK